MIVEQRGQIGALGEYAAALGRREEPLDRAAEALVAQRVDDVEHLFGVLLVGDQPAEMMQRLERTESRIGAVGVGERQRGHVRSEEHTSELQSLMRNPYAVFCWKKKNSNNQTTLIYQ